MRRGGSSIREETPAGSGAAGTGPRRRQLGLGEAVGRRGQRERDAARALEALERVRGLEVGVGADVGDAAHGGGGDVAGAALLEDLLPGARFEPWCEQGVDLVGVLVVHVETAAEAALGGPAGRADHLHEALVLVALGGLDRDPAVRAAEELVRVRLAEDAPPLAAAQPVGEQVADDGRAGVDGRPDVALGDVDDRGALAVTLGLGWIVDRAEGGDRGHEAGLDRRLGERHLERRPAGRADADAGAPEGRGDELRAPVVVVGAGQAERRDRADDVAAEAGEAPGAEAPGLVATWLEVEHEGVGVGNELAQPRRVRRLAALALVEEVEGRRRAAAAGLVAAGARPAQRVAPGRLDLDEVRAEPPQQLAGVGCRATLAQLDDPNAREGVPSHQGTPSGGRHQGDAIRGTPSGGRHQGDAIRGTPSGGRHQWTARSSIQRASSSGLWPSRPQITSSLCSPRSGDQAS